MVTSSQQTYCYHFNATGHVIAMTDQSQQIVNAYAYDPYGNITNQQETISQPFTYIGQYGVMTEPNGFYYMRARYYDPKVGRFISEDPIGFEGGDTNLYAYVNNNPIMGVDASGEIAPVLLFVGGKALAAVIGYGVTKGTSMLAGWMNGNYAQSQVQTNQAISWGATITGGQAALVVAISAGMASVPPAMTLARNPLVQQRTLDAIEAIATPGPPPAAVTPYGYYAQGLLMAGQSLYEKTLGYQGNPKP